MKIVFLSGELPGHAGGIGTYISCLSPALALLGHDVHVISCGPGRRRIDRERDGYWIHERPTRRFGPGGPRRRGRYTTDRIFAAASSWLAYRSLNIGADVVEAAEWMAEGLAIQTQQRTPCVVSLHTPVHLICGYNDTKIGRDLALADRLERASARRARLVTSPSELLAQTLTASGWIAERPEVVRHPIDLDAWSDIPDAGSTDPFVLVVGRLEPRKAPELVLEAAAHLRDRVSIEVVFVGHGSLERRGQTYREWLASRAATLDVRARFVDDLPRNELRAHYARARLVVVPSRFESMSMVALEAMASGRPVVCTDAVGAAELIAGTRAGAVTPRGDALALAEAMLPYLSDAGTAHEAGVEARRLVAQHCAPDLIAAQRVQIYHDVAASTPRRGVLS